MSAVDGAQFLLRLLPVKYEQALSISDAVQKLTETDWNDPKAAAIGQLQMAELQRKMPPDVLTDLMAYHNEQKKILDTRAKYYAENPGWVTAQRYGKYLLSFSVPNVSSSLEVLILVYPIPVKPWLNILSIANLSLGFAYIS